MTDKNLEKFLDEYHISKIKIFKPHKYILLYSIANLYENNFKRENKFTIDELIEPFFLNFYSLTNTYPFNKNIIELPFLHLSSNKFWFLKIKQKKISRYYEIVKNYHSRFTIKRIK